MITEGKVTIALDKSEKISKKLEVFYNPVMELNRTVSVLLLNCIDKKDMQIALPLSGSGVRGIRFLKELKKDKIKNISFNDYDKKALESINDNLKLNSINLSDKIILSNQDANLFLLNSSGFDYIDIDPFGTPNPFLDSSVRRISRGGILAVTATDTSALSGTYIGACMRKYWAKPLRIEIMHEMGIRILIRKCQLIGAQFDKAFVPIYSYSKDHYMRVFFLCEKGKKKVDSILKEQGEFMAAGPMFLGRLWDIKLAKKIFDSYSKSKDVKKEFLYFLEKISQEAKINTIGFYHLPSFAKKNKLGSLPKQEKIISEILKKGFEVSETHFKENSIRSNISEKNLVEIIKKLG